MAICSAEHTGSAGMLGAIAQPTTLRENRSITAARYSQPLCVRM
jgi:hypothetical protein